jgi:hypothetical protein
MVTLYNPDELSTMAVQVMANYIAYFTNWTIMINNEHYQEACDHLNKIINIYVPPFLANKVTLVFIRPVNQRYNKLKNDRVFKNNCEKLAPVVLKSVIHKCVNSLDCIPNTAHRTQLDYYKVRNCDLVYKTLSLLHGLSVLRLGIAQRTDDMILDVSGFRDTLQEFASRSCWDSDIETLAKYCKRLRCLDISSSESISDGVVDYILMFEHLEELNLCEVTSLSEDALQRILKGLAEDELSKSEGLRTSTEEASSSITGTFRSERLLIFGCNNPLDHHITMIAQFRKLTSLAFSNVVNTNLTPLKNLKYLEDLVLKKSKFSCAAELLTSIGNQLECLNIVDVSGTDYNSINVNCPSLPCLHLCFEEIEELCLPCEYRQAEQSRKPAPEFPRIHSLQLFVSDPDAADYVVAGCKNLRSLYLETKCSEINLLVDGIMERKNLIHLREVFWEDVAVMCSEKECCIFKFHSDGVTVRNMVKQ